ncbi:hypothetical protein C0J52_01996 [Blattella germanica]|nr:hypothetical protein C0J52_01996 [Blattella germanica]
MEVEIYKSKQIDLESVSVAELYPEGRFFEDRSTQFVQGSLGNCWLVAAVESLRHDEDAFTRVVKDECNFEFWERGDYTKRINLVNNAVPAFDGAPVFMKCLGETNEYWGILLEKAFAKWLGCYEALEGGFWSFAMQAFTGGVIERIKMRDRPDDLFDYMVDCYKNGSSLCCILKRDGEDEDYRERYHTLCCIKIIEGDSKIMVRDPSKKYETECHEVSYDEFTELYHRLDICHKDVSNLSKLRGRNIGEGEWIQNIIDVHESENILNIELEEPDDDTDGDDDPKCTIVLEVVRAMIVQEGRINPWHYMETFSISISDIDVNITFPQETFVLSLPPGQYTLSVENAPPNVYLRIFSKKNYNVQVVE